MLSAASRVAARSSVLVGSHLRVASARQFLTFSTGMVVPSRGLRSKLEARSASANVPPCNVSSGSPLHDISALQTQINTLAPNVLQAKAQPPAACFMPDFGAMSQQVDITRELALMGSLPVSVEVVQLAQHDGYFMDSAKRKRKKKMNKHKLRKLRKKDRMKTKV
jgi:hypothetical protein